MLHALAMCATDAALIKAFKLLLTYNRIHIAQTKTSLKYPPLVGIEPFTFGTEFDHSTFGLGCLASQGQYYNYK